VDRTIAGAGYARSMGSLASSSMTLPISGIRRAPEVTVVIPTRNRWRMLSEHALASALDQKDVDLEVVVVDDASTEPQPESAVLSDPRVTVIRQEHHVGQARARNLGIAAARGQWIAFLDDDDIWSPIKLRTQLDAAASGASFVYTSVVVVDSGGRVLQTMAAADPSTFHRDMLSQCMLPAGNSTVMVESELLRRLGGFDEHLAELADWDLWIRLSGATRVAACEEPLIAYFIHPGNRRVVDDSNVFDELRYLLTKHAVMRAEGPVEFDAPAFAAWVARGRLRAGHRFSASLLYLRSGIRHRSRTNIVRSVTALLGSLLGERALAGHGLVPSGSTGAPPSWVADRRLASSSLSD
jgi:glycosyltransferase involved in cell wall biosynthesis